MRNKIAFVMEKDDVLMKALERMEKDIKKATESALRASKQYVTASLVRDSVKPNYPHQGKYSNGDLKKSIDTNYNVDWEADKASIKVGYDFNKSGLLSVFMLYGVKKRGIDPANKLYDDIFGQRTEKKIIEIQEETIMKFLQR